MKKHKKLYAVIILLIIVVLIFVVNNIKICSIYSREADYVFGLLQSEHNPEKVDICILDYDYVTGASWRVEKSTNKDIENEYVCLNAICNPRLLKINEEFDLDYMAKYVVVIDKNIAQTKVDDEDVNVLKAKEIVITNFYYQNEGFGTKTRGQRQGDTKTRGRFKDKGTKDKGTVQRQGDGSIVLV